MRWCVTSEPIDRWRASPPATPRHGGNGWRPKATTGKDELGSTQMESRSVVEPRWPINTVRRRTGIAKQFFAQAIKAKLITENPFTGLAATVRGNEARQFFVGRDLFRLAIEHAPGAEWEAIIALSRLGGLRSPSEIMRLRWEDLDFVNGRLRIHSTKTEHHEDGGLRFCPLFVELRPYLERLADLAQARGATPTDPVIAESRGIPTAAVHADPDEGGNKAVAENLPQHAGQSADGATGRIPD